MGLFTRIKGGEIMKHYYISHMNEETKQKNKALWMEILKNGVSIKGEWHGDYWVAVFSYRNKIYELWENMEYGIMSEIVEKSSIDEEERR